MCGGTSGPKAEINLPALFFKQFEIIGSSMGSYQEFAEVTQLMARGLAVHVDEVVGLADYAGALERMEAGEQLGKIVLRKPDRRQLPVVRHEAQSKRIAAERQISRIEVVVNQGPSRRFHARPP